MSNTLIKIIGNSLNAVSYISPKYASKKALHLFATPRQGRVLENQKAFLGSAEVLHLKYKNFNIATYHWKGNNKTILLAHGWESNTQRWQTLIEAFKTLNYTIIALDAPAHGASSGKQFNAIIYSECINVVAQHYKPQIIIGHSVGGMASGFFQYKYQNNLLEKLILLGAPSEFTGVFKRYVNMMSYNKRIENGLNNLVLQRFNNLPAHFSLSSFAKKIKTKTLVIHDTEDKIIPFSDAKMIANSLENGTFISTKGYGHGLRNKAVNNYILEFIAS